MRPSANAGKIRLDAIVAERIAICQYPHGSWKLIWQAVYGCKTDQEVHWDIAAF
jgi:hypothetical protein